MDTIAEVLSEQCQGGSLIKLPQFPYQLCPLSFCLALPPALVEYLVGALYRLPGQAVQPTEDAVPRLAREVSGVHHLQEVDDV